jgi:sugar phosphate isomerase/epimerase
MEVAKMNPDRRQFLQGLAVAGATLVGSTGAIAESTGASLRIGMCDWNLGKSCQPGNIPKAKEAHLQGIQVSVGLDPKQMFLREPAVRREYLRLGKEHGIVFHSVAAGLLNQVPLKSEPQAAVFVIDALEAASALGAKNVLLAFFGAGDLRKSDAEGRFRNVSQGPFKSYELDEPGAKRVVEALRQIIPRAEDQGVVLGIENTLSAQQNLEILEQLASPWAQIYYDFGNSTEYGYDAPSEVRLLGNRRICEIHLKDWHTPLLGAPEGKVDFAAAARACRDIGYDKWYVLETSGRKDRFIEDTRANVAFARKMFG